MVDARASQDPNIYPEPEKFDIYRFIRMREQPQGANKAQFVATSPEHLHFGHGMHACPGRFFAATELKLMMAHLITHYDFKLEKNEYPAKLIIESHSVPNHSVKVLFRKRAE